jgi:hypothetical protein
MFWFYFLEEERKIVQLKVKDVIMNTAKEETAKEEVAINKTVKNKNTEIIFLRDNRNNLNDSVNSINLEYPKFLFRYLLTKRVKSKN